jgi:hypothetical protein
VFHYFQNKGYLICPGDIYGSDYGIYKGADPSRSHSVGSIRVVRGDKDGRPKVLAKDILSFTRVQNQVAKSAVFTFVQDKQQQQPEAAVSDGTTESVESEAIVVDEDAAESKETTALAATRAAAATGPVGLSGETELSYVVINFSTVSDRV